MTFESMGFADAFKGHIVISTLHLWGLSLIIERILHTGKINGMPISRYAPALAGHSVKSA